MSVLTAALRGRRLPPGNIFGRLAMTMNGAEAAQHPNYMLVKSLRLRFEMAFLLFRVCDLPGLASQDGTMPTNCANVFFEGYGGSLAFEIVK